MEVSNGYQDGQRIDDSVMSTNSSEALSSPPPSPPGGLPPLQGLGAHQASSNAASRNFSGVANHPTSAPMQLSTTTSNIASLINPAPPKKPGRKRKEVNPEEAAAKAKEPKKSGRKPRVVKEQDPNAPPAPTTKRKRKAESDAAATAQTSMPAPEQVNPLSRQPKITDLVNQTSNQPTRISSPANIPRPPSTPNPRPASSGQIFDPIRGSTYEAPPVSPTPPLPNRASASPSIKSLIDPMPPTSQPSRAPSAVSTKAATPSLPLSSVLSNPPQNGKQVVPMHSKTLDPESKPKKAKTASNPPSNAPTPPQKPKISREVPPLPTGSGLLSGVPFGISAPTNGAPAPVGTNIWIRYDLKGKENVTINFAHEVEKKYGLAALNPRLAARKERQRQVAAAGAALEKEQGLSGSAHDMSLDVSEAESQNDTDVAMKDANDDEPSKKKQRKSRTEDYDRNDDFIDDAELLLEEQALMTKDGFFVYSGPLIQDGERPAVERADGTIRRGRGRGRGRGGAAGEPAGRGSRGGRGARGGGTVRKPRVTKAERAAMEQEKIAREKMAASLAGRPVPFPTPAAV